MTRLEILCLAHNVQGGIIHEYNRKYNLDILKLDSKGFFKLIYAICLKQAQENAPDDYAWPSGEYLNVYEKMSASIDRMSFNKDTQAFKRTCKLLGIKHTYQAIKEYCAAKPVFEREIL